MYCVTGFREMIAFGLEIVLQITIILKKQLTITMLLLMT
jgi:hypothetical protein